MRYLGIDYGSKRIGIALSDESNTFALPYSVIENKKNLGDLVAQIKKICEDKTVTDIVIGESKDYSGKDNPIMNAINTFVQAISAEIYTTERAVAIHLEPEFMTSVHAERTEFRRPDRDMSRVMESTGAMPSRRESPKNKMLDASAAALILKSFLGKRENKI